MPTGTLRRGRYKQLLSVNNMTGPAFSSTYAEFLQEKEKQSQQAREGPQDEPLGRRQQSRDAGKRRSSTRDTHKSSLSGAGVRARTEKSLAQTDQKLQVIEAHMFQHRQEERELQRMETDIQRQQKVVKKTLKQFENDVERRQRKETNWLLGKQNEMIQEQQREQHEREQAVRERSQAKQMRSATLNQHSKQYIKKGGILTFQYQKLLENLEQKKNEVNQLSRDFEFKLRSKEVEQHEIKKQLADLAISLNMETQKKKKVEVELKKDASKTAAKEIKEDCGREEKAERDARQQKMAESQFSKHSKKMSNEVKTQKDQSSDQLRKHGRQMAEVRNQMDATRTNQKLVKMAEESLELERKGHEHSSKMEFVDSVRQSKMQTLQKSLQERNSNALKSWETNAAMHLNEEKRIKHEERLKQLQRVCGRIEQQEYKLYANVKDSEAQRRKQEVIVSKLREDLDALKRANAKKLKDAAVKAQRTETDLEGQLLKATAELQKSINQKEENLKELTVLRNRAKEDRNMLTEEKKERDRRQRITQQTELLQTAT